MAGTNEKKKNNEKKNCIAERIWATAQLYCEFFLFFFLYCKPCNCIVKEGWKNCSELYCKAEIVLQD